VIATINKEYAGQGQKVMNAMWGAGQMMFNKILVLANGVEQNGIKIDDYGKLAKEVFDNLNPVTDIYFSQGPMDVLDHSCSKMGFGGKMCIDGTRKTEEEQTEVLKPYKISAAFSAQQIMADMPEVNGVNELLMRQWEIPVLMVSMKKDRPGHVRDLHTRIAVAPGMEGVKMVIYVEHTVDIHDIADVLWRFCNNLDPRRDNMYAGTYQQILGLDGTRKTKRHDNFDRPWPNIIAADDATIAKIDAKWSELGLGELLKSPSLKYKTQLYEGGATVLDSE
jgi:4-hydroxy-3-polyprenylbenzoate decarboxylase